MPVASAFDAAFRARRRYYRALVFPRESLSAAEASSAAKVEVGSGRAGPKGEEEALKVLEDLFEKSTWMGGYSVAVLKLILPQMKE